MQQVFLKNGNSWNEIKQTFASYDLKRKRGTTVEGEESIRGVAVMPYCQTVTNRLAVHGY